MKVKAVRAGSLVRCGIVTLSIYSLYWFRFSERKHTDVETGEMAQAVEAALHT